MYIQQNDVLIDKTWSELLHVITEDENLRVRKQDIDAFWKTDVVEFYTHLKQFELRVDERTERVNSIMSRNNG